MRSEEQSGLKVAGPATVARRLDLTDRSIGELLEALGRGIGVVRWALRVARGSGLGARWSVCAWWAELWRTGTVTLWHPVPSAVGKHLGI